MAQAYIYLSKIHDGMKINYLWQTSLQQAVIGIIWLCWGTICLGRLKKIPGFSSKLFQNQ
jgi:hypothetical protein